MGLHLPQLTHDKATEHLCWLTGASDTWKVRSFLNPPWMPWVVLERVVVPWMKTCKCLLQTRSESHGTCCQKTRLQVQSLPGVIWEAFTKYLDLPEVQLWHPWSEQSWEDWQAYTERLVHRRFCCCISVVLKIEDTKIQWILPCFASSRSTSMAGRHFLIRGLWHVPTCIDSSSPLTCCQK